MVDLEGFLERCDTVSSFFAKVKKDRLPISIVDVPRDCNLEIVRARDDYALLRIPADSFDESVKPGLIVHPYGASIGYALTDSN